MSFYKSAIHISALLCFIGCLYAWLVIGNAQSSMTLNLPLVLTAEQFPEDIALLVQKTNALGNEDLYWSSSTGNLDYRITRDASHKYASLASPDGEMIVYQEMGNLRFIDAYGMPILTVPDEKDGLIYDTKSWSPDGSFFWYLRYNTYGTYSLNTVNLITVETAMIATQVYIAHWYQLFSTPIFWLPDNRIAYNEITQGRPHPYLINADGTKRERLNISMRTAAKITNVLPDGRIVIDDGATSYAVQPDGSQLTWFPASSDAISPDGTRIATTEGVILDLEGNILVNPSYPPCNTHCYFSRDAKWSPDGKYIALSRHISKGSGRYRYELFLVKTDGSQTPTLLITDFYTYFIYINFSFSPDSDFFAYTVDAHTHIRNIEEASEIHLGNYTVQGGWHSP